MVTWLYSGRAFDVASGAWRDGGLHAIGGVCCVMRDGVVASNDF